MKGNSTYKTQKLPFASFLIVSGKAELVGVEPTPGSRNVTFILSRQPSDEEISAFFTGSGQVSALRYSESLNCLKGVAYEAKRV